MKRFLPPGFALPMSPAYDLPNSVEVIALRRCRHAGGTHITSSLPQ